MAGEFGLHCRRRPGTRGIAESGLLWGRSDAMRRRVFADKVKSGMVLVDKPYAELSSVDVLLTEKDLKMKENSYFEIHFYSSLRRKNIFTVQAQ